MSRFKIAFYTFGVTLILLYFFAFFLPNLNNPVSDPVAETPDYLNHPIYKTYEFPKVDSIISMGLQPLYLPAGWIFEVVKRDTILNRALSNLGLTIQYYSFLKGDDVNFFLQRGDLDAGIGGDMPALTIAASGDVIIPAMVQYGFTSIVAHNPILIKDLRGKQVGFAYGSNAHFTLLDALSSEGLTENDVDFISMETTEMISELHKGRIDAFSSWEPVATIAVDKCEKCLVIHRSLSAGYLYFPRTFTQLHPEAVRHIIAAEIRAIRWLRSSSKNLIEAGEWVNIEGRQLSNIMPELSKEQIINLASEDLLGLAEMPIIPKSHKMENSPLYHEFRFLKKLGKVPDSVKWVTVQKSFDRTILMEILTNSEKYNIFSRDFVLKD